MKNTVLNLVLLTLSLSFVACGGSSGGGGSNDNNGGGGRTGQDVDTNSSALAQGIVGIEFCSQASTKYEGETDYYTEHVTFSTKGSYKSSRVAVGSGEVKDIENGSWGAGVDKITIKAKDKAETYKATFKDYILTFFITEQGQVLEFAYEPCDGVPSQNGDNNTSTGSGTNPDPGIAVLDTVYCATASEVDETGRKYKYVFRVNSVGTADFASLLTNEDRIIDKINVSWSATGPASITFNFDEKSVEMKYTFSGSNLIIEYKENGVVKSDTYATCNINL